VPVPAGLPVRIVIPDLQIDAQVVEMGWVSNGSQSEWDMSVLKKAVGHHVNSAALGVPGNVVISGHNNIYSAEFKPISQSWPPEQGQWQRIDDFTDRSDVLNGLVIHLYNAAGQQFDYTIREFYRLKDTGVSLEQRVKNAHFMQPTADARLTLVTCWPVWSNTHRLIVVAKPAGQP
jgi:sortase A